MRFYAGGEGKYVIFDAGCTLAVTPCASDFEGPITTVDKYIHWSGVTVKVIGEGIIVWRFRDEFGVEQNIQIKTYTVPSSKVRLFSPQQYFRQ